MITQGLKDYITEIEARENRAVKLMIKPLSVNDAWRGRRFKTDDYKIYEKIVMYSLPNDYVVPKGKLSIHFEFGLSNALSDWDNSIKQLQDILQKKYKFNDKDIFFGSVLKVKVNKGEEYFKFDIKSFDESLLNIK